MGRGHGPTTFPSDAGRPERSGLSSVEGMLSGKKILITGPAGQIAYPMTAYLAAEEANNEVWGIARFSQPGSQQMVDAVGAVTREVDLASGDFGDLPTDFDYLIHLATYQGGGHDYDRAFEVNAEGTGLLLEHCRNATAALVASTFSVYAPNPDPGYLFSETDPLGDARLPHSPTYSMSKMAQEAVTRTMARVLDLPVTIGRINGSYGPNGGLPAYMLDWLIAGDPIYLRAPGQTYNLVHADDMNAQVEGLLGVASVPATIVNWSGDDAVTVEDMVGYMAELTGKEPNFVHINVEGSSNGNGSDNTRRRELIGDCSVDWRDGVRAMFEARYPNGVDGGLAPANQSGGATLGQAYEEAGN